MKNKHIFAFCFCLLTVSLSAAVISQFNCNARLTSIVFPTETGTIVNWGTYPDVVKDMPNRKADIDDSIVFKIQTVMTNDVSLARGIATSATNYNITIPAETWEYINTH